MQRTLRNQQLIIGWPKKVIAFSCSRLKLCTFTGLFARFLPKACMPMLGMLLSYEVDNHSCHVWSRYRKANELLAHQMWQDTYSESNKYGFGHRLRELHILSGLVLPIWPDLERVLKQQSRVYERRLNVVRLETTGSGFRSEARLKLALHWALVYSWIFPISEVHKTDPVVPSIATTGICLSLAL